MSSRFADELGVGNEFEFVDRSETDLPGHVANNAASHNLMRQILLDMHMRRYRGASRPTEGEELWNFDGASQILPTLPPQERRESASSQDLAERSLLSFLTSVVDQEHDDEESDHEQSDSEDIWTKAIDNQSRMFLDVPEIARPPATHSVFPSFASLASKPTVSPPPPQPSSSAPITSSSQGQMSSPSHLGSAAAREAMKMFSIQHRNLTAQGLTPAQAFHHLYHRLRLGGVDDIATEAKVEVVMRLTEYSRQVCRDIVALSQEVTRIRHGGSDDDIIRLLCDRLTKPSLLDSELSPKKLPSPNTRPSARSLELCESSKSPTASVSTERAQSHQFVPSIRHDAKLAEKRASASSRLSRMESQRSLRFFPRDMDCDNDEDILFEVERDGLIPEQPVDPVVTDSPAFRIPSRKRLPESSRPGSTRRRKLQ